MGTATRIISRRRSIFSAAGSICTRGQFEHVTHRVSGRTTLKKLVGGRYKFAAAEKKVALLAISRNKSELEGKIKIVGRISNGGLFVSFSKKHPYGKKYCDLLNQGIVNIKNSGEYETLEKKWDSLIQSGNLP